VDFQSAGFVGTAKAAQVVVAGPLVTGTGSLGCLATNLADESQNFRHALINSNGIIVGDLPNQDVDPLQTITTGDPQAEICLWEIYGAPESWRFTACSLTPNAGYSGSAVQGRVAPGMKFPE
jgi:hypothetical protein